MNTKLYFYIAFRIVMLFGIAIASTYLPEQLRSFFGDQPFICKDKFCYNGTIDKEWIWGVRHYWFFWMMVLLFALSLVDGILSIVRMVTKYYPQL